MKQSINPAIMVIAIVAVVAVACFFGFRALNPPNASSNLSPAEYRAKVQHNQAAQQQNVENMKSHVGGMGSSAGYQQMMQQRQQDMSRLQQQHSQPQGGGGG